MKSLIDELPAEIAKQIHPNMHANEAAYWVQRDQLSPLYRGQLIAFADDQVIAASESSVGIIHAAQRSGLHPFVTRVGRERQPFRVRSAVGHPMKLSPILEQVRET